MEEGVAGVVMAVVANGGEEIELGLGELGGGGGF